MPCRCDHLEPTRFEIESREVARHLVYAMPDVPDWVSDAAGHIYGAPHRVDELTRMLCEYLGGLSAAQKNALIYDARSRESRSLAGWWEAHQEADRVREEQEKAEARRLDLVSQARAKLSSEEKAALGI